MVLELDESFFKVPSTGEVFDTPNKALHRLNGYALTQGFAIVRDGGSEHSKFPYLNYKCIHHGTETRNTRKLEEHVQRNSEGEIVSNHKQEQTSLTKRDCKVTYGLSHKQVNRGSGVFSWVLKVPNPSMKHSHELAAFGLRYNIHRKASARHTRAVELAKTHREAFLSYQQSSRILDRQGLSIGRKEYYNLRRHPLRNSSKGFEALIVALEEASFVYSARCEEVLDPAGSGKVIALQLEQVWFAMPCQLEFARRFISGFALLIDGTFQTNALNLVLLVMQGISNTNKTFPACFSFARSEGKMSFDFAFKCLRDFGFAGYVDISASPRPREAEGRNGLQANHKSTFNCTPPRVVISNQAKGLIASLPTSLPNATL